MTNVYETCFTFNLIIFFIFYFVVMHYQFQRIDETRDKIKESEDKLENKIEKLEETLKNKTEKLENKIKELEIKNYEKQ